MERLGINLFVPFKTNSKMSGEFDAWTKAYLQFTKNPEEFSKRYHKRSTVESVFSSIKTRFGEELASESHQGQINELYCKGIAYNISVLITQYFTYGFLPEFMDENVIEENMLT